jgi:hypothetical protein
MSFVTASRRPVYRRGYTTVLVDEFEIIVEMKRGAVGLSLPFIADQRIERWY